MNINIPNSSPLKVNPTYHATARGGYNYSKVVTILSIVFNVSIWWVMVLLWISGKFSYCCHRHNFGVSDDLEDSLVLEIVGSQSMNKRNIIYVNVSTTIHQLVNMPSPHCTILHLNNVGKGLQHQVATLILHENF